MERIESLIIKLKEQYDQRAPASQLLSILQQLQNELTSQQSVARTLGTSKVAVVMPASRIDMHTYEQYAPKPSVTPEPVKESKEKVLLEDNNVAIVQENGQLDMVFDPLTEIPTLSHQPKSPINTDGESLNDRLRQTKVELMEVLKETPVKDLRKAIGINDRFLFINDLFRGDEVMYERSIKTINGFNIYAEAEYWISRELKVKLSWNIEHPSVQHFDQLVKRRFT